MFSSFRPQLAFKFVAGMIGEGSGIRATKEREVQTNTHILNSVFETSSQFGEENLRKIKFVLKNCL
jgi:hypothetical protein